MSMTREEAIYTIERLAHTEAKWPGTEDTLEALDMALTALRPVSREQVERMRGEWTTDGVCSRCGFDAMYYKGVPVQVRTNYCPACGSPMTDKAVDMVMERLGALRDE